MRRFSKLFFAVLCIFMLSTNVYAANGNTSLKDLKDKLAEYQNKANSIKNEKDKVVNQIKSLEKEINNVAKDIDECEEKIAEATKKIEQLGKQIDNKQLEIDNLMNFEQISSGDNVYLEYIFYANSFVDFIYRVSVVEQLSKYNDGLIDEMNALIKENKKTKETLNKKIDQNEKNIIKLNSTLKKSNLSLDDLVDDHKDAEADLLASKKEVEAYEKIYKQLGCDEKKSITDCMSVPYADKLSRPLVKASVTSNFGLRYHPTLHYYRMHNGIDLGVSMGTKVYASAAGIVTKITRVANPNKKNSSCGGNVVYVRHSIGGKEYTTVYMHLHTINVKLNEFVTLNSVIGTSGGGESYDYCTTGPHLHFGVVYSGNYVNPRNYIKFPSVGGRFTSRW